MSGNSLFLDIYLALQHCKSSKFSDSESIISIKKSFPNLSKSEIYSAIQRINISLKEEDRFELIKKFIVTIHRQVEEELVIFTTNESEAYDEALDSLDSMYGSSGIKNKSESVLSHDEEEYNVALT